MEALMTDGGHVGDREQFWRDHVGVLHGYTRFSQTKPSQNNVLD